MTDLHSEDLKYSEDYLEKLHGWSHALGVLLGIFGFIFLLTQTESSRPYSKVALVIYSISILFLFSASALYHLSKAALIKSRLRTLDHIAIYFLIAGTYTPVCIIILWGSKGWFLLALVWGIALFGILLKMLFPKRFHTLALILYLLMGWLVALDFSYLLMNTSFIGLWLLAAGGIFYTVGVIFYVVRNIPFNHLIWHIFVLLGAMAHWFFIAIEVSN